MTHTPRNINHVHAAEQAAGGFNQHVAVGLTKVLSSMLTFWIVAAFVLGWIVLQFTPLSFDRLPYSLLLTLLNLPQISMMIALGVGQNVLGRKQELQADEAFHTTQKSYEDIERVMMQLERLEHGIVELLNRTEGK